MLRWSARPRLRRPVMLCAFEGWNDAGDAASFAVRYLGERWGTRAFADVDPEEHFDFTTTRPRVQLVDGHQREIAWPGIEFSAGSIPGTDRDVILLEGSEPQLRWRTFCEHVVEVATAYDVELVVTLGALLAEVPHSRPVITFVHLTGGAAARRPFASRPHPPPRPGDEPSPTPDS